jgi:hypothetical protein
MTEGVNLVQLVASDNLVEDWHAKVTVIYIYVMCVVQISLSLSLSSLVFSPNNSLAAPHLSMYVLLTLYTYICVCLHAF